MKSLALFSLAFALIFTACQKDDYALPELQNVALRSSNAATDNPDGTSLLAGNCKDIVTDHFLVGKAEWSSDLYDTWYVIEANGEAALNEAVGRSELSLNYDLVSRSFAGRLITRFDAAEMEHTFYGRANAVIDANQDPTKGIIEGETDLVSGVMTTAFGILQLTDGGVLKISVFPGDEGEATVSISIAGPYCSRTKVFSVR